MEAEARFWEDVEQFRTYAALGYSPKYCHDAFIAAKHIRMNKFRVLLAEAGIEFAKPSQWRDSPKKTARGKKYRYRGKLLTASQLVEAAGGALSLATLQHRLSRGWEVEKAVNTPIIDPRVSGARGAAVTNSRRRNGSF